MNKSKSVILATIATFIAIASIFFVACKKPDPIKMNGIYTEECKGTICQNGGTCINGSCACPFGYEGIDCKNAINKDYKAVYLAYKQCATAEPYNVIITPDSTNAIGLPLFALKNSCDAITTIKAKLDVHKNNIVIPMQKVCKNLYIKGTGSRTQDLNTINLNITERDTVLHTSFTCGTILQKQ